MVGVGVRDRRVGVALGVDGHQKADSGAEVLAGERVGVATDLPLAASEISLLQPTLI